MCLVVSPMSLTTWQFPVKISKQNEINGSIKIVLKLRHHWLIEYKSDQHVLYKNLASFIVRRVDIVTDLHISRKYNIQVAFVIV